MKPRRQYPRGGVSKETVEEANRILAGAGELVYAFNRLRSKVVTDAETATNDALETSIKEFGFASKVLLDFAKGSDEVYLVVMDRVAETLNEVIDESEERLSKIMRIADNIYEVELK